MATKEELRQVVREELVRERSNTLKWFRYYSAWIVVGLAKVLFGREVVNAPWITEKQGEWLGSFIKAQAEREK